MIPSAYVHPSTKQCNYSVDLSGYAKSSELNSLKTSVSSGKQLVASAVTGKGVSTAADASFQTIANNINSLKTASKLTLVKEVTLTNSTDTYQLNVDSMYFLLSTRYSSKGTYCTIGAWYNRSFVALYRDYPGGAPDTDPVISPSGLLTFPARNSSSGITSRLYEVT